MLEDGGCDVGHGRAMHGGGVRRGGPERVWIDLDAKRPPCFPGRDDMQSLSIERTPETGKPEGAGSS